MVFKIKKNIKIVPNRDLIPVLFALKLFSDAFYKLVLFDVVLLIALTCLLVQYLLNNKFIVHMLDYIVLLLMLLFIVSTIKDVYNVMYGIKVLSGFVMYFWGRIYYNLYLQWHRKIYTASNIILAINILYIALGNGFILWGSALTLKGLYFFKTDFALFLSYFLVFNIMMGNISSQKKIISVLVSMIGIILSNARIYYVIMIVILYLYHGYKKKKKIAMDAKKITGLCLIGIGSIFFLNNLNKIPFLSNFDLLGLDVTEFKDLFTGANSQGRTLIWGSAFQNFSKQSLLTKCFGAGINFTINSGRIDEHSLYLKTLVCTGYVGLFALIVFIFYAYWVCVIIANENLKIAYITLMLLTIFLVSGYSTSVIIFTANTWFPFFSIGAAYSIKVRMKDSRKYLKSEVENGNNICDNTSL